MDYKQYSKIRSEARAAFDAVEDWMADAFGNGREALLSQLDAEDLDQDVARRRRGIRYFAAGRARDQRMFASWLFPMFRGDPHERSYRDSVVDILRVAGNSVAPRTRHKLSFDLGVLYFTADARGHMYGVVASDDFPMPEAFKFLDEILEVYEGVDISAALDTADSALWNEDHFRNDAFGVKSLAETSWKKVARPGDGLSYDPTHDYDDDLQEDRRIPAPPPAAPQGPRAPQVAFSSPDAPPRPQTGPRGHTPQVSKPEGSWLSWW